MTATPLRIGLDINRAGPRLRRYVTHDAPRIMPGAQPVQVAVISIRATRNHPEVVRRKLGEARLPLYFLELAHDGHAQPTLELPELRRNIPTDLVAPTQYELVDRGEDFIYAHAAGIRWWLVFSGEAFAPWEPKGPTTPGTPGTPIILTGERLAA